MNQTPAQRRQSHIPQEKQINQNINCLWVIAEIFIEPFPTSALLPGRQHHRGNLYHWHPLLLPNRKITTKAVTETSWAARAVWSLPGEGWMSTQVVRDILIEDVVTAQAGKRVGISSCMKSWGKSILYRLFSARQHRGQGGGGFHPTPTSIPDGHFLPYFQKLPGQWKQLDGQ